MTIKAEKNALTKAEKKEQAALEKKTAISDTLSNILYWQGAKLVKSDVEVGERLTLFFRRCAETGELPTVEKMSLALGTYSERVNRWEHGQGLLPHMTESTTEMIRRAKHVIAAMDAELAMTGRANTNVYVFRAKNYYGMKDQVETVVTANKDQIKTPEQLQKRYGNVIDVKYEHKKPEAPAVEVVEDEGKEKEG